MGRTEESNHVQNAEKFHGALDRDAAIYQKRVNKSGKEHLKELRGKNKFEYFREYYGKKVLVAAVLVFLVVYFTFNYIHTPDTVLGILAVNADGTADEEYETGYFEEFIKQNGVDSGRNTVSVNRSVHVDANSSDTLNLAAVDNVVTLFMTQAVDVFLSDEDFYRSMAAMGYCADLREYLTEEQLTAVDGADLLYETVQETGEERLVGIRLQPDQEWLARMGWYEGYEVFVGVSDGSKHEALAAALLLEILSE